jgi:hypothetical protein
MKWLTWILTLFKRGPRIPHPEEPKNPKATTATVFPYQVTSEWMKLWQVPKEFLEYWMTAIELHVYDAWPEEILKQWPGVVTSETPAYAIEEHGVRHLYCLAVWLNPGVVAHEQAHTAWALLDDIKLIWNKDYQTFLSDPIAALISAKISIKPIENHAEIYRFLGEKMPKSLKKYYPKLF